MADHRELERSCTWLFDFSKLQQVQTKLDPVNPVVPVVVQDANTKEVLIVAYVNKEALMYSLEHGIATFWSTSRNELWIKGKSSGDVLNLKEVRVNCEQNSLLYLVEPVKEGSCHVKDGSGKSMRTCYYRKLAFNSKEKNVNLEILPDFTL